MTDAQWTHHTRRGRRSPGGLWWLAVLLVPLVLAAAFMALNGSDIESDLEEQSTAALRANNLKGAKVTFDGRDATVTLPDRLPRGMDRGDAKSLVTDVDGVRTVTLEGGGESGRSGGNDSQSPTDPHPNCNDVQGGINKIVGKDKVSFQDGSATITGDEKRQLGLVAQLLAACDGSVEVIGYADPGAERTSLLAQQRADGVAGVLEAVGVVVNAAEGAGAGEGGNNYVEIVVS